MASLSRIVRRLGPLGLYGLARQVSRRHPRILMYHRFSERPRRGFVSRETLEQQMALLARDYHPIGLQALIEALRTGERPPPHAVVVTVDDGYGDFHDVAWPVMKAYGIPATLFVTTGFVDRELWLWPDQVAWMLDRLDSLPEHLSGGRIRLDRADLPEWNRESVWQALIEQLLDLPDADKHASIAMLADGLGLDIPSTAPPEFAAVTWDQLRRMQSEGLEVGGHTHTHPTLPKVPAEQLDEEIERCRDRIDAELGARLRPFCYPNGQPDDFSQTVRDHVERAGFTGAVVAFADAGDHNDLYTLRRHAASESGFQYQKAVTGLEWWGRRRRLGDSTGP